MCPERKTVGWSTGFSLFSAAIRDSLKAVLQCFPLTGPEL